MNFIPEIVILDNILRYQMTPQEAKAYKLNCVYLEYVKKMFPHMSKERIGRGDPRKTYLFKVCIKAIRELQHQLPESEYHLFVKAQLDIIKINNEKRDNVPNITPTCIVGEKAWKRWCVWKKVYDQSRLKQKNAQEVGLHNVNEEEVKRQLKDTKETLVKKLKSYDCDKIKSAIENRTFLRWLAVGQISPYYAILSPQFQRWVNSLNISNVAGIDFSIYNSNITDNIKDYFKELFPCEFEEQHQ